MSIGEAWWFFERPPTAGPNGLLELLHRQGISYHSPLDDLIYIIDETGSRRKIPLDFVLSEWDAERVLTMQLWINANTDVIITAERGGSCVTFDLDGLLLKEAISVVTTLLLCACLVDGTRALIVDRQLPDRGDEWSKALTSRRAALLGDTDLALLVESDGTKTVKVGPKSWLRDITS